MCGMRQLLQNMPPLCNTQEEVTLRETLLNLEKQIASYCHHNNIPSPPPSPTQLSAAHPFNALPPVNLWVPPEESEREKLLVSEMSLEPPTTALNKENGAQPYNGGGPCLSSAKPDRPPLPRMRGGYLNGRGLGSGYEGRLHANSPPPPPPPPLPSSSALSGGVRGTVQFIGALRPPEAPKEKELKMPSVSRVSTLPPEDKLPLKKDILAEISSVGQSALRRTTRARTPGGTPVKSSLRYREPADSLQHALLTKFQAFHSTPVRQGAGSALDFSSTWSDVYSPSVDFADPDITAGDSTSDFQRLPPAVSPAGRALGQLRK